ncbi:hypothetical protein FP744_10008509 [Trichoderma asperellum]|nr:hypothetical protein LI328DRAFT_4601 [Trichoderma asperelloides]
MDQAASDISTCSADDCLTPTSSTMTDAMFVDEKDTAIPPHIEYHPVANRSFMIRTRQKPHRYLTLEQGELKLLGNVETGGGWLWYCFKNCGWYGFLNTVSGTHLGHDKDRIVAKAPHHRGNEFFIVDRQTDGGYTLLARKHDQLLPVVIAESHDMLLGQAEKANGMAWEFVDTKFISMQVYLKHL